MGERQLQQLVFGGGLDRATGVMLVEEASFEDLRNVYLFEGKASRRKGLDETLTFFAAEQVLHVHPIRAFGIGAIFTYDESTREVWLYRSSGDGTSTTGRFLVWTLPETAGFPRISCDDSYGKLYIAHDEPTFAARQDTKVYDPSTDTITDLKVDFYQPTGLEIDKVPVKFRVVKRHLNYLVGAGYGTEQDLPGDTTKADRPEIVRISLPGEPDNFQPQHYVIVGQRYEPVVGLASVAGSLIMRKETDSHLLVGDSRANFGVRSIDELFGVVTSRLHVTVGDKNYFWSLDGPRVSGPGPSADLSLPLNLSGPIASTIQNEVATEEGFAMYNPQQREVLFVFGRWAYVLHLRDETPRWSYRQYAVPIGGGGTLYSGVFVPVAGGGGGGTGVAPDAYPTITSIVAAGNSGATVNWDNTGTLAGAELAEIWAKPEGGLWTKVKDAIAVAGLSESEAITGLTPGLVHDIAVRFKLVGVYTSGYESSNPSNWPPVSRGQVTMGAGLNPPTDCVAAGFCAGTVPRIGWSFTITDGDKTRVQWSKIGNDDAYYEDVALLTHPNSSGDNGIDYDEYYWYRFRHENTAGTDVSPWVVVEVGSMLLGTCG